MKKSLLPIFLSICFSTMFANCNNNNERATAKNDDSAKGKSLRDSVDLKTKAETVTKENYISDDVFFTKLESGVGEIVPVKFKLSSDLSATISSNKIFQEWDSTTYSNPKNAKFVEKWKNQTHLETYLIGITKMAGEMAKIDLKNGTSFSPIADSQGFINIMDDGSISVTLPFKAQNGNGNMVFAKAYYTEKIKGGKVIIDHFISNE